MDTHATLADLAGVTEAAAKWMLAGFKVLDIRTGPD